MKRVVLLCLCLSLQALGQEPSVPPAELAPQAAGQFSLAEAALTALKNHPDLKIADGQIEQAQAQIRSASAPFFPRLQGNVNFSYSEAQSANVGGQQLVRSGGIRNYNIGISASQLLTDFGRTQTAVDAADATKEATLWQKEDSVQTLLLRVAESYFSVLRAQQDVAIQLDNVRNAEVQLGMARSFYEAGTRAKIEVTRAESDLANAQVGLIVARNNQQKAEAAFLNALGLQPATNLQLQSTELTSPNWEQAKALELAQEVRPDLKASFARIKSAQSRVRNAESAYFPSLSATYRYGWAEPGFLPQPYNWNVGMQLSVPLLDEPNLSAGVQAADAALKVAEGNRDLLALQIQQQAVEAWLNLQESRSRLEAAQVSLRANEENYRLASERYNVGVGASLEVSDAQRLLVQARSQEVQARFDVQLSIARLYRQVGSLTFETFLPSLP